MGLDFGFFGFFNAVKPGNPKNPKKPNPHPKIRKIRNSYLQPKLDFFRVRTSSHIKYYFEAYNKFIKIMEKKN